MNKLSLKVTRQGLADAYVPVSLVPLACSILESTGFLSGMVWGDLLGLSLVLFIGLDKQLFEEKPILARVMWWPLVLVLALVHVTYFVAAKTL